MGKKYSEISDNLTQFIENQKIFFVGTAAADGRVNISPKGMDSLRIIDANRVLWLSVTGSGNETSAHVQENPRMTIMFIALEGKPMILRLYGNARVIHKSDSDWEDCASLFELLPGARQIFDLTIDLVHTSCGMGVPFYNYTGERDQLNAWANKKGEEGIKEYWREKNEESLDGKITHIIEKNI
jgi:hypothetical protein